MGPPQADVPRVLPLPRSGLAYRDAAGRTVADRGSAAGRRRGASAVPPFDVTDANPSGRMGLNRLGLGGAVAEDVRDVDISRARRKPLGTAGRGREGAVV